MSLFAALRAGYGVALVLEPGPVIRLYTGRRADRAATAVARLLGTRHLIQALLTLGEPDPVVLALGAEADIAHSASMVGLAALDARRRRGALVDAAAAGSFAVAGAILARRRAARQRGCTPATRLAARRDAAARRIAARTVPTRLIRGPHAE